jgi:peptide/nickel transport system permease protein
VTHFVLVYFSVLVALSCLAAYAKLRQPFLLLFSFTAGSALAGAMLGTGALHLLAWGAGLLMLAGGVGFIFREFLAILAGPETERDFRTAPLTATFGLFVIAAYAVAAIFAPLIAPFGEAEVVSSAFAPPDGRMLLGADQLGRDLFSRLVYGARNSVGIALAATVLAFVVGAFAGLLAAVRGGAIDMVLGRLADVVMSVPSLIFALLMLSILGTSVPVIVGVVAVIYSPRVFRLSRAVAGNIVVMDYIEAARLRGEGTLYLIRREILPSSGWSSASSSC